MGARLGSSYARVVKLLDENFQIVQLGYHMAPNAVLTVMCDHGVVRHAAYYSPERRGYDLARVVEHPVSASEDLRL
jgi:hypothetical protein